MVDLFKLLNDDRLPSKAKNVLEYVITSLGPLYEIKGQSSEVISSWGLSDYLSNVPNELFTKAYGEATPKLQGLMSELSKIQGVEGVIVFGSVFKGHYANVTSLLQEIKAQIPDEARLDYLILCELFHYPEPSDVDLCIIGDVDNEAIVNLMASSDLYFEHATIINKNGLDEVMSYFQNLNSGGNLPSAKFDYLTFSDGKAFINGVKVSLPDQLSIKLKGQSERFELMRSEYKLMIDELIDDNDLIHYLKGRFNAGLPQSGFDLSRVLRAMTQSFIIAFNPMVDLWVNNVNYYASWNVDFKNFITEYPYVNAFDDICNNERLDKWHFLKAFRMQMLEHFIKKYKLSVDLPINQVSDYSGDNFIIRSLSDDVNFSQGLVINPLINASIIQQAQYDSLINGLEALMDGEVIVSESNMLSQEFISKSLAKQIKVAHFPDEIPGLIKSFNNFSLQELSEQEVSIFLQVNNDEELDDIILKANGDVFYINSNATVQKGDAFIKNPDGFVVKFKALIKPEHFIKGVYINPNQW